MQPYGSVWPLGPSQCHGSQEGGCHPRALSVPCPPAEVDPGYRPMYSGDIPLDPIDMHMDMDGDYPMDAYSDVVRAPFTDHMLA